MKKKPPQQQPPEQQFSPNAPVPCRRCLALDLIRLHKTRSNDNDVFRCPHCGLIFSPPTPSLPPKRRSPHAVVPVKTLPRTPIREGTHVTRTLPQRNDARTLTVVPVKTLPRTPIRGGTHVTRPPSPSQPTQTPTVVPVKTLSRTPIREGTHTPATPPSPSVRPERREQVAHPAAKSDVQPAPAVEGQPPQLPNETKNPKLHSYANAASAATSRLPQNALQLRVGPGGVPPDHPQSPPKHPPPATACGHKFQAGQLPKCGH